MEGQIYSANQAAVSVLECDPELLVGMSIFEFIAPKDLHLLDQFYVSLARSERAQITGITIVGSKGTALDVTMSVFWSQIKQSYLCIICDVTDEKRAAEMKENLRQSIGDRLRGPLQEIVTILAAARETLDQSEMSQSKQLGECLGNANFMYAFAQELVNSPPIELKEAIFGNTQLEAISLGEALRSSLAILEPQIQKNALRVEISVGDRIIVYSKSKLLQVFNNLLANAVSFSPQGGAIYIESMMINSQRLRISITDEGPGISKGDLSRIFEPFVQLNQPNYKRVGSGLGLAICREIVESRGGSIGASQRIGSKSGTTFWFEIPV